MPLRLWILEDTKDNSAPGDIDGATFLSSLSVEDIYIFEERAAIMEYDGGLSREEAEQAARKTVLKIKDSNRVVVAPLHGKINARGE